MEMIGLEEMKALKVLGRGSMGTVFLVGREEWDRPLALKVMNKCELMMNNDDGLRRIEMETVILSSLQHPFLPSLLGRLETEKVVGLVGEYCPGGDLNALRHQQPEKTFSDSVIRFYAAEIVIALEHLHSQGILYRDLKPENILIQSTGHIMLTDFDLSTRLSPKQSTRDSGPQNPHHNRDTKQIPRLGFMLSCLKPLHFLPKTQNPTHKKPKRPNCAQVSSLDKIRRSGSRVRPNSFVGTEEYVAPEMVTRSGHDSAVDWWALGILIYEMLYGKTPFKGATRKETFSNILVRQPHFMGPWTPLRDLIIRLLEKEPQRRIGAGDIKKHLFFQGLNWSTVQSISRPPFVPLEEINDITATHLDIEQYVEINAKKSTKNTTTTTTGLHHCKDEISAQKWVESLSKGEESDAFEMF